MRAALRRRAFRHLLGAQVLSCLGDELARLALAILVFQRSGSPALTALTYAASVVPWLLLGPFLATLGDRLPRRAVLVTCDLLRAVLAVGLATRGLSLPVLFALLLLLTAAEPPFDATRAALLADLLVGDAYVAGQALMQAAVSTLAVVGYGAGGLLVLALGAHGALLLDAVSFLGSALLLLTGVPGTPAPAGAAGLATPSRRTGLDAVLGDRRVRWLVLLAAATAFFDVVPVALVVPWAASLGGGSATAGLLAAAAPLGAAVSGIVVARVLDQRQRLWVLPRLALVSVAVLALALAQPSTAPVAGLLLVSGAAAGYQVIANQLFVQSVPAERRAAAFGVAGSALVGAQGAALIVAGLAAEVLAPALVVGIAGVLGSVAVLVLWARRPDLAPLLTGPVARPAVPAAPRPPVVVAVPPVAVPPVDVPPVDVPPVVLLPDDRVIDLVTKERSGDRVRA